MSGSSREWPPTEKVKKFEVLEWPRTEKERLLKLISRILKTLESSKVQKEAGCSAEDAEGTASWETLGRFLFAERRRHCSGKQMQEEAHAGMVSLDDNRWSHRNGRKARLTVDPCAGCSSSGAEGAANFLLVGGEANPPKELRNLKLYSLTEMRVRFFFR